MVFWRTFDLNFRSSRIIINLKKRNSYFRTRGKCVWPLFLICGYHRGNSTPFFELFCYSGFSFAASAVQYLPPMQFITHTNQYARMYMKHNITLIVQKRYYTGTAQNATVIAGFYGFKAHSGSTRHKLKIIILESFVVSSMHHYRDLWKVVFNLLCSGFYAVRLYLWARLFSFLFY